MAGKLTLKSSMVLMKRLFSCLGSRRKQWIMGYLFSLSEISLTWILPFLYEQTAMLAAGEPGGSLYRIGMYFGWLLLFVPLIVLGAWMRNTAVIYGEGALKKALFARLCRLNLQDSRRYVTAEICVSVLCEISGLPGDFRVSFAAGKRGCGCGRTGADRCVHCAVCLFQSEGKGGGAEGSQEQCFGHGIFGGDRPDNGCGAGFSDERAFGPAGRRQKNGCVTGG